MKRAEGGRSRNFFPDLIARYLTLIVVSLPNLWIFYFVFTPLTLYPVYYILSLFFGVSLVNNTIIVNDSFAIELIRACIAGAAYYFLLVLNLATPGISIGKRLTMIAFAFLSFLALNILRILILVWVFFNGFSFFDVTHNVFWYVMSTVFVIMIWFTQVKMFNLKGIPFYSDLKLLYKKLYAK